MVENLDRLSPYKVNSGNGWREVTAEKTEQREDETKHSFRKKEWWCDM
jgi:hypothetical protein